MKRKADFYITWLSVVAIAIMLLLNGCNNESSNKEETTFNENASVKLKAATSASDFEKDVKSYFNEMLDQQIVPSFDLAGNRSSVEVAEVTTFAAEDAARDDGAAVNVSGTNLVEAGVDEADLVKSDGRHLFIGRQGSFEYIYFEPDMPRDEGFAENIATDAYIGMPYGETRVEPASIRVMALDNDTPNASEVTAIEFPERVSSILGLYLSNVAEDGKANQLIVVSTVMPDKSKNYYQSNNTWVVAYDVSNPAEPSKQWDFEVEGYHHASRAMNGKLYLIASNYFWLDEIVLDYKESGAIEANRKRIENLKIEDILPDTWVNGTATDIVKASDCLVPEQTTKETVFGANLLTVYTIPTTSPEQTKSLCTVESSTEVYVSPESIYFTKGEYVYSNNVNEPGKNYTVIHKLAFTEDSVAYKSSVRIPGWTGWRSRSFRMNEYNSDLRIVVSDYEVVGSESYDENVVLDDSGANNSDSSEANGNDDSAKTEPAMTTRPAVFFDLAPIHRLYVLRGDPANDNKLAILSQLPNKDQPAAIGKPGEDVYAVRYFGDHAYVVTFRNTDPLYAINLKDPKAPFIEGELEIPGYSDYLHPVNENLLLGIGNDATENGVAQGIKVALFDVSDKSNPVTVKDFVIGKRGSSTTVSYDYHAFSILSDSESGVHRVALPVNVHETLESKYYGSQEFIYYGWTYSGLQLLEIDDGSQSSATSMTNAGTLKAAVASEDNPYHYQREPRSVIVNDAIHYIESAEVWSAMWDQPDVVNGPN